MGGPAAEMAAGVKEEAADQNDRKQNSEYHRHGGISATTISVCQVPYS